MIMAPVAKNSRPNDPLSVLVLTDYYPPWIGGGQRASRELAVQLAARGYDVAVATVWQPGTPRFERDASVDVHRLSQSRTLLKPMVRPRQQHHPPFPDPVFVAGLRRILRRHNPSVVYAYGWVTYSFLVANVGLRIPLVLAALDYGYSCPTRTMLRDGAACSGPAFERCLPCASRHYGTPKGIATFLGVTCLKPWLRRRASGMHGISSYVSTVMHRDLLTGRREGSVVEATIPCFSDERDDEGNAEEIERNVAELPIGAFILFVGTLNRRKGVDVLLEAYQALHDPPPLVLIGTRSPETPAAFPEGVTVLTDVPHGAVMQAWRRSLFAVLPSVWPEPLGLVVHEAMSQGRAVIGTTPGGHTDLIEDGESGILVPAGDADALRDAMNRLLEDVPLRTRLGSAATERAAATETSALIPRYEDLLRSVTKSGASGPPPSRIPES